MIPQNPVNSAGEEPGYTTHGSREAYLDVECMSQEREFPQDPATEALTLSALKKNSWMSTSYINVHNSEKIILFKVNWSSNAGQGNPKAQASV